MRRVLLVLSSLLLWLTLAAQEIRRLTPMQILAGGLVYPDLDWVEEVCGITRDFDILPVHAYSIHRNRCG